MDTNGRTEAQKLVQSPVEVVLGGRTYQVKLLSIRASAEWRRQAADLITSVTGMAPVAGDDAAGAGASLRDLMSSAQDKVAGLFFAYARELPRDEIENAATEAELAVAFDQIVAVAFPLGRSLTGLARMGQATS